MSRRHKSPRVTKPPFPDSRELPSVTDHDLKSSREMFHWSLEIADYGNDWGFNTDILRDEWCPKILPKLKEFERLTWGQLANQAKGRGSGTKHHHVQVSALIKKAKKRLKQRDEWDDTEQLYSLRLDGKSRIYGIVVGNKLNLIWYDPGHEIYPNPRK